MRASSFGIAAIFATLLAQTPVAVGEEDFGLHNDRANVVQAELDENWALYQQYMWNTVGDGEIGTDPEAAAAAIAYKQSDRRTGIRLQSERVDSVALYQERDRQLAILEVTRLFTHPLSPAKPVAAHNRIYGVREAGEPHWRFNVSSCFSPQDLAAQFPSAAQAIE